jgi:MFS family permease
VLPARRAVPLPDEVAYMPIYGKLGDPYGRKVVLQSAVATFLAGSALCGAATGMAS